MRKRLTNVIRSNAVRLVVVWAAQILLFAFSGTAASLLRFDFSLPSIYFRDLAYAVLVWVTVKSLAFHFANLDKRGFRYVSISDAFRILCANLAGSAASYLVLLLIMRGGFPRSIYLIDLIFCTLGTTGLRVTVRLIRETVQGGQGGEAEKRTLSTARAMPVLPS